MGFPKETGYRLTLNKKSITCRIIPITGDYGNTKTYFTSDYGSTES